MFAEAAKVWIMNDGVGFGGHVDDLRVSKNPIVLRASRPHRSSSFRWPYQLSRAGLPFRSVVALGPAFGHPRAVRYALWAPLTGLVSNVAEATRPPVGDRPPSTRCHGRLGRKAIRFLLPLCVLRALCGAISCVPRLRFGLVSSHPASSFLDRK